MGALGGRRGSVGKDEQRGAFGGGRGAVYVCVCVRVVGGCPLLWERGDGAGCGWRVMVGGG